MSNAAASTTRPGQFRMPPLGLAAALILWGIENQVGLYAALMAAVLEGALWVPWRWHLTDKDFNRLSDATALGFLLVVVYVFDTYSFHGVYVVLQWLPFVLFLLAVAQRYGTRESIRYSALFLSVRRAERKGVIRDPGEINFDLPYLVVCLVSATGGTVGGLWLFAGLAGVLGYLLWYNRPRKLRAAIWLGVMFTAIGLGYLNQLGLLQARRLIEPVVMDFFRDRVSGYRDPFRSYTAMGQIGRMKLSDRIVLRVTDEDGHGVPTLLREAAYRVFSKNIWMVGSSSTFEEQLPDTEGTTWALEPVPLKGSRTVRIARSMFRGKALLAVPDGTFQIEDLPVEVLERHPLGALKVKRGPGLIRYTARYMPERNLELSPGRQDLVVPRDLEGLMSQVTDDLNLKGAPVHKAIQEINRFFLTQFKYSVTLRRPGPVATPLHGFLLKTRTGHCEFFASATVLLLRHLGIPARYATGYSVQEYSPLEKSYIVRRRHAHSWALAYVDGRWIDLDTTPSVWADLEAESAPWWEGAYDFLSWLGFRFSWWRWRPEEEDTTNDLLWLIVPLLGILLWRLSRTERVSRRRGGKRPGLTFAIKSGADSDLYELIKALSRRGLERAPGEPLRRWLGRLGRQGRVVGVEEIVTDILPIHYRYRFDPRGISAEEREILRRRSRDWLKRHPA
jgi:transglutaminase-like putative cysteine protease